jgi:hypothetical protein
MQHISAHLNQYKNLSMQEFNNLHKTMNTYIVTSTDGTSTELPNSTYQEATDTNTIDEYETSDLYDGYEAEIVIGTYEAKTEAEAMELANNELIAQGYANDLVYRAIKIN